MGDWETLSPQQLLLEFPCKDLDSSFGWEIYHHFQSGCKFDSFLIVVSRTRGPYCCPHESLIVPNKTHIGDGISFFEAVKTFLGTGNIHMETIPCTYTWEFPVFKKSLKFFSPVFKGFWKINKVIIHFSHQNVANLQENTVSC